MRALLDAVDPGGERVARFAVHDATLDDVFLALTGRPAETNDDAKEAIHARHAHHVGPLACACRCVTSTR